jgi:hypothetical protein
MVPRLVNTHLARKIKNQLIPKLAPRVRSFFDEALRRFKACVPPAPAKHDLSSLAGKLLDPLAPHLRPREMALASQTQPVRCLTLPHDRTRKTLPA